MTLESQFILITNSNGGLSIMQFVTKGLLNEEEIFEREPTDENVNSTILKAGIDAASWRFVETTDIPIDRTFRNAWRENEGKISVDLEIAKNIQRDRLRFLRVPLLEELDVQYQKADEVDDKQMKKDIIAKKQILRDITNSPELISASTSEELKFAGVTTIDALKLNLMKDKK